MTQFKGTRGKWNIRGNKIFVNNTYLRIATIHVVKNCKDVTFEQIEDIEAKANAKLFSKAPEMLAMLQRIEEILEYESIEPNSPIQLEITKLIKEATTL